MEVREVQVVVQLDTQLLVLLAEEQLQVKVTQEEMLLYQVQMIHQVLEAEVQVL
jgi:hypothetical protein